jgi:hypothetical protein
VFAQLLALDTDSGAFDAVNRGLTLRRTAAAIGVTLAGACGFLAAGSFGASAHDDPCHLQHLCPADHHDYVWVDPSTGDAWDCAE